MKTGGTDREHKKRFEDAWHSFADNLKKDGHRITKSRRTVFYAVANRSGHFTAEQLASELATGSDKVSRGTVYRTLSLMEEKGILRSFRDCQMHFNYESALKKKHHEHIVCECCGHVIEFSHPELRRLLEEICIENEFHERDHSVVILGKCKECSQKKS
ncbi:MAG: transcriptional repressor [Planctomycetota bacterium]|nr:transcriptional repressor [Planctomycetota bacterium]